MTYGAKISIGINYWDDAEGLMRLLQSLPNIITRIYIIDGAYPGRYEKPRYKDEMTMAIVHSMRNITYIKMNDAKQIDKRNKYWELAQKDGMEWLIVIDSDEYMEIDEPYMFSAYLLKMIEQFPKSRCFPIEGNNLGHFTAAPRLFRAPFNYRHIQQKTNISHGSLYDPDGKEIIDEMYIYYEYMRHKCNLPLDKACVPFIKIIHDKKYRDKKRIDADYLWYSDNPTR